jgi:hypothetical protein
MGSLVTKLTSLLCVSGCIALLVGQLLGLCTVLIMAYPVLPRKQYCQLAHWFQNRFLTTFVYLIERNHSSLKLYFSGDALPPGVHLLSPLHHCSSVLSIAILFASYFAI